MYDVLWNEYLKPRWGIQRLVLYGNKKRTIDKFLDSIQGSDSRKVVIAYGSAKIAPTGKGESAVPTGKLYSEVSKRFETHGVDEFRTSKVSNRTGELLTKVYRIDSKQEVRGLRWCGSTSNGKFLDRDMNAAINILRCFLGGESNRPSELSRETVLEENKSRKMIRNQKNLSSAARNPKGLICDARNACQHHLISTAGIRTLKAPSN